MGAFARQTGTFSMDQPLNLDAPFNNDEFPALGGMGDGHRQGAPIPQHLAGQANGVYDPRQQGGSQLLTPPPNSQNLQQQQDHRTSMLEALQGQRGPPRTAGPPNSLGAPSVKDGRLATQGFPNDDQKVSLEYPILIKADGLKSGQFNRTVE